LSTKQRHIAILGSTGSIGTQALQVIEQHSESLFPEVLTAHQNAELLIEQARHWKPNAVVIGEEDKYDEVQEVLDPLGIKVFAGEDSIADIVELDSIDMVLVALVGYAGVRPTLKAIEAGKTIALANKETMVVAGELVTAFAREKGVNILPIDSEHSAIFQCLRGEFQNPVEKVCLTASGGPFFGKSRAELQQVTREQALDHPNWDMGNKITIDSATMMNKGLEVIEARWLFDLKPEQIDVVVHPQSIVHSLVQFQDGAMKAELGCPDMRQPILYALAYPKRMPLEIERLDLAQQGELTFYPPDPQTFPCLQLAYDSLEQGGNAPCALNAANEIAVDAFLQERIKFLEIPEIIEESLQELEHKEKPSYEDYFQTDQHIRKIARQHIKNRVRS
jgi:1-deoxy-D-xylulose-5-phosphate reductoisomerase